MTITFSYPREFDTLSLDPPHFRSSLLAWDADGTRIACARTDKSIKVAKFDHIRQKFDDPVVITTANEAPVAVLIWECSRNARLTAISTDFTLKVWEIKTKAHKLVRSLKLANTRPKLAKYSPDGRYLAIADNDANLTLLDSSTLQLSTAISIKMSSQIGDLDWDADSETLICGLTNGSLQLYRVQNNNGLHAIELIQSLHLSDSPIVSIKYMADRNQILTAGLDGQLLVVDAQLLICIKSLYNLDDAPVCIDTLTPAVAISYQNNNVRIFDIDSGEEVHEVKNSKGDNALAKFHPQFREILAYIDGSGKATVMVAKKRTGPARALPRPVSSRGRASGLSGSSGPSRTIRSDRFERPNAKRPKY
ncbi:hypothetical protein KL925_004455 [Ogataea polymorpha]|nr:hypothetical protein KL925_004455 [Ogataea polymorpha]